MDPANLSLSSLEIKEEVPVPSFLPLLWPSYQNRTDEDEPAVHSPAAAAAAAAAPLKFHEEKQIGQFAITGDDEYSPDFHIPGLIPDDKIEGLKCTYLGRGFETFIHLENYDDYHDKKQTYFLQWLANSQYFQKVREGVYKKPDIICFGGRISDPLIFPLNNPYSTKKWEVRGAKFMDAIFLWGQKSGRGIREKTLPPFYGAAYEALMTGKDPAFVNGHEISFIIQEVKFGKHQLLLLNVADSRDDDGKLTEIKVSGPCGPKMLEKYLTYWALCVVPNVNKILLGRHTSGRLENSTTYSIEEVLELSGYSEEDIDLCYQFEDRLLSWIKSQFKENDPKLVKKFSWNGFPNDITCSIDNVLEGEWTIPEWFIQDEIDNVDNDNS